MSDASKDSSQMSTLDHLVMEPNSWLKSIYVLKLEHGCFYVGKKSSTNNGRLQMHFNAEKLASEFQTTWVNMHPAIDVVFIFNECTDFDEDLYTRMFMSIYGIDNVRGGSYSCPKLPWYEREVLETMLPKPDIFKSVRDFRNQRYKVCCALLKGDRYFVAKLESHESVVDFAEKYAGEEWLQMFPYVRLLGMKTRCSYLDIDKYVTMMICRIGSQYYKRTDDIVDFGIERVRGGSFSSCELTDNQKNALKSFALTAFDVCYKCHQQGHYSKSCTGPFVPRYNPIREAWPSDR